MVNRVRLSWPQRKQEILGLIIITYRLQNAKQNSSKGDNESIRKKKQVK